LIVLPSAAKLPLLTTADWTMSPALEVHADRLPDSKPSPKTGAGFAVGVGVRVNVGVSVSVAVGVLVGVSVRVSVGVKVDVKVGVGVKVSVGVADGIGVARTLNTNWGACTPSFEE